MFIIHDKTFFTNQTFFIPEQSRWPANLNLPSTLLSVTFFQTRPEYWQTRRHHHLHGLLSIGHILCRSQVHHYSFECKSAVAGGGGKFRARTSVYRKVIGIHGHINQQSITDTNDKKRRGDNSLRPSAFSASQGSKASTFRGGLHRWSDVDAKRFMPAAIKSEIWRTLYGTNPRDCDSLCYYHTAWLLLGRQQTSWTRQRSAHTVSLNLLRLTETDSKFQLNFFSLKNVLRKITNHRPRKIY